MAENIAAEVRFDSFNELADHCLGEKNRKIKCLSGFVVKRQVLPLDDDVFHNQEFQDILFSAWGARVIREPGVSVISRSDGHVITERYSSTPDVIKQVCNKELTKITNEPECHTTGAFILGNGKFDGKLRYIALGLDKDGVRLVRYDRTRILGLMAVREGGRHCLPHLTVLKTRCQETAEALTQRINEVIEPAPLKLGRPVAL